MIQQSPTEERADTVAFVQEWLMNADYDPSQFDRDFAAAIDARCAALTSQAAHPVEADGWVMVPRELIEAAIETYEGEWGEATSPNAWPNRMKSMLAATPPAPNDDLRAAAELVARAVGVSVMPDGTAWALVFPRSEPQPLLADIFSARAALKENRRG